MNASVLNLNLVFIFQSKFGIGGSDPSFNLFQSDLGRNLLFKDSTKCLQEIRAETSYDQFLGAEYMNAMASLRNCTDSTSGLYNRGLSLE